MDRVGDQFFAGAGLALNEDGRVGLCEAIDQLEQVPHRGAAPDELVQARFVP